MKFFYFFVILFCTTCYSQTLEDFTYLKSQAPIPDDFTVLSSEKFETELESNINEDLDDEFFLSTRFFIDELLLSGLILFNEPVSIYLNDVADYVLKPYPEIREELRFYILKSNSVNAFSTDQGIIIFTSGLMAKLENEAQLAFIIAHEVSHYTSHHVRKGYVKNTEVNAKNGTYKDLSYDAKTLELSRYNKDNELEADLAGAKIYLQSEYATSEIMTTFDILLYSELPFSDIAFNKSYFNSEFLYIPAEFFPDTIRAITVDPEIDDDRSSHPNIKTRVEKITPFLAENESAGDKIFKISEERFLYVRDLARFESLNILLANGDYNKAIYTTFLLHEKYPENRFLDLSLLKAFYGLTKFANNEIGTGAKMFSPPILEGEASAISFFTDRLSKQQLNVMSYRLAIDFEKKYEADPIFASYKKDLFLELAINSQMEFDDLKSEKYLTSDSTSISKKRRPAAFHQYALSDCFTVEFKKNLKKTSETPAVKKVNEVKIMTENERIGIKNLIIVDPQISIVNWGESDVKIKAKRKSKLVKAEKLKVKVAQVYAEDYSELGLKTNLINSSKLGESEIDKYNELGAIHFWMRELIINNEVEMISSSKENIDQITNKYGTSKFLFSNIYISKDRTKFKLNDRGLIILFFCWPCAVYTAVKPHNNLNMVSIIVDAKTSSFEYIDIIDAEVASQDLVINNYIYNLLYRISKSPNNE
ncbi:MAG: hypothetical protein ACI8ZM_005359 [Crocinitomix sp.]|jgi:hypothetical protein